MGGRGPAQTFYDDMITFILGVQTEPPPFLYISDLTVSRKQSVRNSVVNKQTRFIFYFLPMEENLYIIILFEKTFFVLRRGRERSDLSWPWVWNPG